MRKVAFVLRFWVPLMTSALLHAQSAADPGMSSLTLPVSGCPQAHCNAHLSDAVESISPDAAELVAFDSATQGSQHGLGCSSNTQVAACTFGSANPPNLVVYNADGRRIFADNAGLLDSSAFASAPIVFTDGKILAVDTDRLILFNSDGTLRWLSNKPDVGTPTSPVLVGTDIVFLATQGGGLSTWDLNTGNALDSFKISDPTCSNYDTQNTSAVNGNRVYVLVSCTTDTAEGGLVALDVDTQAGPSRGTMELGWFYRFTGPSGASPLYHDGNIFFDGVLPSDATKGVFMGVQDTGSETRSTVE